MFYRFACFILYLGANVRYRIKVSGAENIPQEGAFILCSNHIHSYDPAMLAISTKRQMRFMAKKELFGKGLKSRFFEAMGAFPVNRGSADMASYRNAMETLKSGMGLLIFSQGTKMQQLDINSAKGGVALFGVKAQVPVIPVGITGSYRLFSRLDIRFGKAISLEEYYNKRLKSEQIEEIMTRIMSEVEKLVG